MFAPGWCGSARWLEPEASRCCSWSWSWPSREEGAAEGVTPMVRRLKPAARPLSRPPVAALDASPEREEEGRSLKGSSSSASSWPELSPSSPCSSPPSVRASLYVVERRWPMVPLGELGGWPLEGSSSVVTYEARLRPFEPSDELTIPCCAVVEGMSRGPETWLPRSPNSPTLWIVGRRRLPAAAAAAASPP